MKKEAIITAIRAKGATVKDAAHVLGYTRQNLYRRLNAGTMTDEELIRLADWLGGRYVCRFEFDNPDGSITIF